MGVWSQVGRRVISRFRLAGPTRAVRRGGSEARGSVDGGRFKDVGAEVSAEGEEVTKSVREGPALRRSRKVVVGRRVWGIGSEASVANERYKGCRLGEKAACGKHKERSRGSFEPMMYCQKDQWRERVYAMAWNGSPVRNIHRLRHPIRYDQYSIFNLQQPIYLFSYLCIISMSTIHVHHPHASDCCYRKPDTYILQPNIVVPIHFSRYGLCIP